MEVTGFIFNLNSGDPGRLAAFYRDVVQLPPIPDMGPHAFSAGGTPFIIDGHSDVQGPATDPKRYLFNLAVDNAKAESDRLAAQGVQFIRREGREEWGGIISTFPDPDGNYCQLLEYHGQG